MSFDDVITTPEVTPATATAAARRRQMEIGGLPQVSLLPSEIKTAGRSRTARLVMVAGVGVAALAAGGMVVLASGAAADAQSRLNDETARSQQLTAQTGKFGDVQKLDRDVTTSRAAIKVGTSTRVDWKTQIEAIESEMPPDYVVKSITAGSATPIVDYLQGTGPLDKPRAATASLTVDAPTISRLPYWLRLLRSMPAYANATASVDSKDETTGVYHVTVTVDLSPKAIEPGNGQD